MDFYSLITNTNTAELIFNLSIQVIVVSLIGWIIMKLWRPRSAPTRSAGYLAVLVSLAALPVFTAMFNINQITWLQSTIELPYSSDGQQTINHIPETVNQEQAGFIIKTQNVLPDSLVNEIDTSVLSSNLNQEILNNVQAGAGSNRRHETLHGAYEETGTSFLTPDVNPEKINNVQAKATGNEQHVTSDSVYDETVASFLTRDRILLAANIFGAAWVVGFIVFILRLGFKLSFLKGYIHNLNTDNNERLKKIYGNIKHIFNDRPMPDIYFSPSLSSPVTIGIIKPVMILPIEMETMSDDELKSILLHELAHIFHRDNFIGFLQHVLSSILWWNPLVYLLNSAYSDSREDVCDNYALNFLKSPKKYANTLLNLAEKTYLLSRMPATAGMSLSRRSLENRVLELLKTDRDLSTIYKPSLIILSLITAVIISSCGPGMKLSFKDAGDPDNPEYYKNSQKTPNMDYRIDSSPGEGWKDQPRINDMAFFLPGTLSAIYVGRIPVSGVNEQMHPEEIYMLWINGMQKKYQWGNIIEGEGGTTALDGRESYSTTFEYMRGYNVRKEKVYFIRGDSYFYRIRYSSPKGTYCDNLQTFEKYVKSFKIVS